MYSGATLSTRFVAGALVLGTTGAVVWSLPNGARPPVADASPAAGNTRISAGEQPQVAGAPGQPTRSQVEPGDAEQPAQAEGVVDDRMTQPMPAYEPYAGDKQRIDRQITFGSDDVEGRVRAFNVDCDRGGATMRLMDVLRIMAREGSFNGFETWLKIEGRGNEARVYRDVLKDGVPQLRTKLVMELNEWDELRVFGIHPDAIKIRCLLRAQRRL